MPAPGPRRRRSNTTGPPGGPRARDRRAAARIELTRRGWSALGAATGLATAGRMLGVLELWIIAVALVALLAAGVVWALLERPGLRVRRSLRPAVARVDDPARAELHVHNPSARPTPDFDVTELIGDGAAVRVGFGSLGPGAGASAAYTLPTDRRGVHRLDPASVTVADPFGLVSRTGPSGPGSTFAVGPRVHAIAAPPSTSEPRSGTRPPAHAVAGRAAAGDFRGLREYESGDDIRMVHWPTTARSPGLMVRQDQPEDRSLVAVAVDVRPGAHDAASFEILCEVVASVAAAAQAAGQEVRALTTAGDELVPDRAPPGDPLSARLAALTTGGPDGANRLAVTADALRRRAPSARHMVVAGRLEPGEDGALARVAPGAGAPAWILVTTRGRPVAVPGAVVVDARESFVRSWNGAVSAPVDP